MRATTPHRLIPVVLMCTLSCAGVQNAAPLAAAPEAVVFEEPADARTLEIAREIGSYQTRLSEAEVLAVARTLVECSEEHGLAVDLLLGVMRVESAFNNFARSNKGALGLMQVLPSTGEMVARDLGIEWRGPRTLFDPVANVRIGSAYLGWLRARYGDHERALAAYNWGPGAIDRRISRGHPVPGEYVASVLTATQTPRFRP
jgi:soluble lytic murein transglycosylase-like protein